MGVKQIFMSFALLATLYQADAQEKTVMLKYGDMNSWVTRTIHESAIIGGNDKTLYEVGPNKHLDGNHAYRNLGG